MNKQYLPIYESEERTATPDPVIINTQACAGLYVIVEVTDESDTPSVVFTFDLWDPLSGTAVNLLTSAAVSTVSSNIYKISPALTASANLIATEHIPQNVRISATHGDSDSITYSVAVHML